MSEIELASVLLFDGLKVSYGKNILIKSYVDRILSENAEILELMPIDPCFNG